MFPWPGLIVFELGGKPVLGPSKFASLIEKALALRNIAKYSVNFGDSLAWR
jgi:hypothetical protein